MDNIVKRLEHRFELIDGINDELESRRLDENSKLNLNKINFAEQVNNIREDLTKISFDVDRMTKLVFNLGSDLKEKLYKHDFEMFKEMIDKWKLEEFITRNELERSFNRYSD